MTTVFDSLNIGDVTIQNRIIMAPLTRMRSKQPGNIPHALNAEYYAQRASAGLIIAEATQISPQGQGYPATPGIHSAEQVDGWKLVTEAVHKRGGKIFLQLWHVGRISHSSFQPDGGLPVSASAIAPSGKTFTAEWKQVPYETPRALETSELPSLIEDYRTAALNAKAAGFDGVEVHSANGYLLDQFLQDGTNKRTDQYGGSMCTPIT
jgi:N-ethylmaleimide reductase